MEKRITGRLETRRKSARVSSLLLARINPQLRLSTLNRFKQDGIEQSEETTQISPGQIEIWPK